MSSPGGYYQNYPVTSYGESAGSLLVVQWRDTSLSLSLSYNTITSELTIYTSKHSTSALIRRTTLKIIPFRYETGAKAHTSLGRASCAMLSSHADSIRYPLFES